LISILTHCYDRGSEIIVGSDSHIQMYEQGGYAHIGGVACWSITSEKDGTLDLNNVDKAIRRFEDPHETRTRLLCLENTHMPSGGRILPLDYLAKVRELTKKDNVKIHMDGARLMNACVGLGVQPSVVLKHVDSVSMCFSKGLGCPIGSIIGGSKEFINQSLRMRKLVGGGMRQVGILAAAALHVLDSPYEEMLRRDHANAKRLAHAIADLNCKHLLIRPEEVETNILIIDTGSILADTIVSMLSKADKSGISVKVGSLSDKVLRVVTHRDISDSDIDKAIEKFRAVANELQSI